MSSLAADAAQSGFQGWYILNESRLCTLTFKLLSVPTDFYYSRGDRV